MRDQILILLALNCSGGALFILFLNLLSQENKPIAEALLALVNRGTKTVGYLLNSI